MNSTIPIIDRAFGHQNRLAIVDERGSHTYRELVDGAQKGASILLSDKSDLKEARVAFMMEPDFRYVAVQWGIWLAGGVAVPLCISYPVPELEYVIADSQ